MSGADAGHVGRPPSVLLGRLSPVLNWTSGIFNSISRPSHSHHGLWRLSVYLSTDTARSCFIDDIVLSQ